MPDQLRYYLGNDNKFYARNVRKTADNSAILGGTGELTLFDKRTGAQVAGQVWPAALVWDAGQKAFIADLSPDLVVIKRQALRAHVTIDGGAGFLFFDDPEIRVSTPSDP